MSRNIDVHMHSLYSDDGEFSPEEIIAIGKKEEMEIMALTDHNSVKGVNDRVWKKSRNKSDKRSGDRLCI